MTQSPGGPPAQAPDAALPRAASPDAALSRAALKVLQQCRSCRATCCTYITVNLDDPGDDPAEYEAIRWYLTRANTRVFVDEGTWYLQVNERCRFLQADFSCGMYANRPEVCRDYDPKGCEYWEKPGERFAQQWDNLEQFDAWYAKEKKPQIEAKQARAKAKRSAAARRAAKARWAKARAKA